MDLIHFTQNKTNVVHASTKENDIIRYLNVEENNYIRYFRGHNKKVVTLCMNPTDDSFLSGSLDKSIRLWDIRCVMPSKIVLQSQYFELILINFMYEIENTFSLIDLHIVKDS